MPFGLDICVDKKTHPTHSVHRGLNPPPSLLPSKTPLLLFCQAPS